MEKTEEITQDTVDFVEKKPLAFEEILRQEDYLLCDTSVTSFGRDGDWYYATVFNAKSFSGLDALALEYERRSLQSFLSLLGRENVLTVRGVSLEIERTRNMISDKIRYLKKRDVGRQKFRGNGHTKKDLLEEIRDLYHELFVASRRSQLNPQERGKYGFLKTTVIDVTEKTSAKIDTSKIYRKKRVKPKTLEDLHTDEELVASALYLATVEERKGAILTRDGDIWRVLERSLNRGSLDGIKDIVARNRVRIHYVTGENEAYTTLDTSEFIH